MLESAQENVGELWPSESFEVVFWFPACRDAPLSLRMGREVEELMRFVGRRTPAVCAKRTRFEGNTSGPESGIHSLWTWTRPHWSSLGVIYWFCLYNCPLSLFVGVTIVALSDGHHFISLHPSCWTLHWAFLPLSGCSFSFQLILGAQAHQVSRLQRVFNFSTTATAPVFLWLFVITALERASN